MTTNDNQHSNKRPAYRAKVTVPGLPCEYIVLIADDLIQAVRGAQIYFEEIDKSSVVVECVEIATRAIVISRAAVSLEARLWRDEMKAFIRKTLGGVKGVGVLSRMVNKTFYEFIGDGDNDYMSSMPTYIFLVEGKLLEPEEWRRYMVSNPGVLASAKLFSSSQNDRIIAKLKEKP
jgi:hypothetical protein